MPATDFTLGAMIQDSINGDNPKFEEASGTLKALNDEIKKLVTSYSNIQLKSQETVHLQEILTQDLETLLKKINETVEQCGEKCEVPDEIPINKDNIFPPDDNFVAVNLAKDCQKLLFVKKKLVPDL